jgi:hypothetical protein
MRYGCPNGHTDGIEQGCQLTVWLPVNADTGETDTDTLDGRETDNWSHGYYYCPTCGENFDHLAEVEVEATISALAHEYICRVAGLKRCPADS